MKIPLICNLICADSPWLQQKDHFDLSELKLLISIELSIHEDAFYAYIIWRNCLNNALSSKTFHAEACSVVFDLAKVEVELVGRIEAIKILGAYVLSFC